MPFRFAMLGAAALSLAACGGEARLGRGNPDLTQADGGLAQASTGGRASVEPGGSGGSTGRDLTISNTTGEDMTCSFLDNWTLTFSADCSIAPLIPIGSGCTGARRYLDWDVTLTRF